MARTRFFYQCILLSSITFILAGCGGGSSHSVHPHPTPGPQPGSPGVPNNLSVSVVSASAGKVQFYWDQGNVQAGDQDQLVISKVSTADTVNNTITITLRPTSNNQYSYSVTGFNGKYQAFLTDGQGRSNLVTFDTTRSSPIPSQPANGVWVYDDPNGGAAGQYVDPLKSYIDKLVNDGNSQYVPTMIFSYGSDMEMYCNDQFAPSNCDVYIDKYDPSQKFNAGQLQVYYNYLAGSNPSLNGQNTTKAYVDQLTPWYQQYQQSHPTLPKKLYFSPIIDGRMDGGSFNFLDGFNSLSQQQAEHYADMVAKQVCGDANVDGVQFDLEPLAVSTYYDSNGNVVGNGSYYFYREIAKDFSGANDATLSLTCADSSHPNGRFFSVFTFAKPLNKDLADALRYHGVDIGYVVDSLYDLGPLAGGSANSPADYKGYVQDQVNQMFAQAAAYHIDFQFAVPAAASVHEFEGIGLVANDASSIHEGYTQYNQQDYLTYARDAITQGLKVNPDEEQYYKGTNIWSFQADNHWAGSDFYPNTPVDSSSNNAEGQ